MTYSLVDANAALFQLASRLILATFSSEIKRGEAAIRIRVWQIQRKPIRKVEKRVRASNP